MPRTASAVPGSMPRSASRCRWRCTTVPTCTAACPAQANSGAMAMAAYFGAGPSRRPTRVAAPRRRSAGVIEGDSVAAGGVGGATASGRSQSPATGRPDARASIPVAARRRPATSARRGADARGRASSRHTATGPARRDRVGARHGARNPPSARRPRLPRRPPARSADPRVPSAATRSSHCSAFGSSGRGSRPRPSRMTVSNSRPLARCIVMISMPCSRGGSACGWTPCSSKCSCAGSSRSPCLSAAPSTAKYCSAACMLRDVVETVPGRRARATCARPTVRARRRGVARTPRRACSSARRVAPRPSSPSRAEPAPHRAAAPTPCGSPASAQSAARSCQPTPHHGARSTPSQAILSAGWISARVRPARSWATCCSSSVSISTA